MNDNSQCVNGGQNRDVGNGGNMALSSMVKQTQSIEPKNVDPSKSVEMVLCISREDLPMAWVGEKAVISMDEGLFFNTLSSKPDFHPCWLDRPSAENDSRFKQIIPYILIQAERGNLTAIYRRQGGERRLHDLWSMGIGGHINPSDNFGESSSDSLSGHFHNEDKVKSVKNLDGEYMDFRQLLYAGMTRELDEELVSRPHNGEVPLFMGTINEELSDVGKVHFGVVFRIMADSPDHFAPGEELVDFQWIKTERLLKDSGLDFKMELWSQMAIHLF